MVWAALRWLPLMFLVAQGLEAPLVAHVSQPLKPIRAWTAKTSWYGGKFQGRRTASGEKYDMYAVDWSQSRPSIRLPGARFQPQDPRRAACPDQ